MSQISSLFSPSFPSLPSSLHFGLVGGGGQAGRGGKRCNAGRKSESRPTDWKKFKPLSKKDLAKIKKDKRNCLNDPA